MFRGTRLEWTVLIAFALCLYAWPQVAGAKDRPEKKLKVDPQSDFYREKTKEFVALAWDEEKAQVLGDFFEDEKEDSDRYLLELGENALFSTGLYRESRLPDGLFYLVPKEQDKVLWLNQRVAELFLADNEEVSEAQDKAIQLLAAGWLQVAERQFRENVEGQRPIYFPPQYQILSNRITRTSPSGKWFGLLPAETKLRVISVLARIGISEGGYREVLDHIRRAAAFDSRVALKLTEDYLSAWDKIDPEVALGDASGTGTSTAAAPKPTEEKLTQEQAAELARLELEAQAAFEAAKLEEKKKILFESLAKLRGIFIDGEIINSKAVMLAFAECHGANQIYVRKDFDKLLSLLNGPKDVIVTESAKIMGERMVMLWTEFNSSGFDDPELAEQEMFGAVREGYALLDNKLEAVLHDADPDDPKRWQFAATLGRMRLDAADFYINQINVIDPLENNGISVLRSFKLQRDAALEALNQATESYCKVVPTLTRAEYSPVVFIHRFESIMQLTDIANAALPANLRDGELRSLRDDLLALEGHVAEGHLEALVQWFEQTYAEVEPMDKYRFLSSFVTVMGDNLGGASYQRKLNEYDAWREEIELHVRVDGDRHIGSGQSFGVFLAFRHSNTIGLDSDIKYYLAMKEYLARFRNDVMSSLHGTFFVKDIRYHESAVLPYDYGREGWQETPLAYVLLEAKDPAIDLIPPIELHLEYPPPAPLGRRSTYQLTNLDTSVREAQFERSVLLPVRSEVIHVNAYPGRRSARPCRDVTITQTFDARNLEKGEIRLTVMARAKGLLPELGELLVMGQAARTIPGFKIIDTRDLGISLNSFDSGDRLSADTSRRWTIELALDNMNRDKARNFHFLKARDEEAEMLYRRYEDADILECPSAIPLDRIPPNIYANARDVLLGIAGFVLLVVGFRLLAGFLSKPAEEEEYRLPPEVTPFTVVTLIHRISGDGRIELSERQRQELMDDAAAIERSHFVPAPVGSGADISSVANRWLKVAQDFVGQHSKPGKLPG
jgi:hypothetical protein